MKKRALITCKKLPIAKNCLRPGIVHLSLFPIAKKFKQQKSMWCFGFMPFNNAGNFVIAR